MSRIESESESEPQSKLLCGVGTCPGLNSEDKMADVESQEDEVEALQSIFTEEEFHSFKNDSSISGQFNAFVSVPEGYIAYYGKIESHDGDSKLEETKGLEEIQTFEKSVKVQYLPPVQLSFKLPIDYPSKSPPRYTISCPWLTFSQLKNLSKQLEKIWDENKGFVVLYSWAQFLKDDCLSFLKLEKSLDLSAAEEDQTIYREKFKMRNEKKKTARSREALSNISNKMEEVCEGGKKDEGGREDSKPKKEECTVLDVNTLCETIKEDQAKLVKLSLYESGSTECGAERLLNEASGSEEVDASKLIDFDRELEVGHILYCSAPEKGDLPEGRREELQKPGPSGTRQHRSGRYGSRPYARKNLGSKGNKRPWGSVRTLPLTEPLWNIIVNYNKMRRKKDFDHQMFSCAVCFEEKIGSQCMELDSCGHVFCRDCLTSFLNVRITEGKVKQLSCPETDCDIELLQSEIRSLVTPELFTKYDTFLLSSTLDTLNVTYCPRKFCQYPVSSDNETMALCPLCDYCFCPFCKMVYHGVEPCRFKLDCEETKVLIKEYGQCSESRKAELEKRYGRKHLQQLLDSSLSQSWLSSNSKQCPKCNASIERTYGCNKMVCLRCNTPFCWLCFEILDHLNPYRHFQDGRCAGKLYLGMQVEGDEDDDIDDADLDEAFDEDDFEFLGQRFHLFHYGMDYF